MRFFHYFDFERSYDKSKLKSSCFFFENIKFSKHETKSEMETPTHNFRETKLVLLQESQFKSKTV